MKLLVTGAAGMLGVDIVSAARIAGQEVVGLDHASLDILDLDACKAAIAEHSPDIIINCAAYTDVDGAETDRVGAFKLNATGVQNLALACKSIREARGGRELIAICHVSTDYVFDGVKLEPYTEFDHVNPINVYGASKLAGERMLRDLVHEHYIVRTSWLYGKAGKHFVGTVRRLMGEQDELSIVADQIGCPTYSADLAEMILNIVATGCYGTYHVTNKGSCSWYGFAQAIFEDLGEDPKRIKPIGTIEFRRPAPRPLNSVLRNFNLELRGIPLMRPWRDALKDYLSFRT